MATGAIAAHGALFKMGDGATPEVFTTVAEVETIGGPKLTLDTIDATSHDSSEGWREQIAGLLKAGEVSIDLNFIPTNATHNYTTGMIHDMVSRHLRNYKIVFPDVGLTTWAFAAYVTGFDLDMKVADKVSASCTVEITGKPTLT